MDWNVPPTYPQCNFPNEAPQMQVKLCDEVVLPPFLPKTPIDDERSTKSEKSENIISPVPVAAVRVDSPRPRKKKFVATPYMYSRRLRQYPGNNLKVGWFVSPRKEKQVRFPPPIMIP